MLSDAAPAPPGAWSGATVLAFSGPDTPPSPRVAVNADVELGLLKGWTVGAEHPTAGTAMIVEVGGGAGSAIWGRWAGGTTGGAFGVAPLVRLLNGRAGLHYALGMPPAGPAPTLAGNLVFPYVGGTFVTIEDGTYPPGTLAGDAAVNFNGPQTHVGFELTINFAGIEYVLRTPGGTTDLTVPGIGTSSNYLLSALTMQNGSGVNVPLVTATGGPRCPAATPCEVLVSGFFSGDSYARMSLVLQILAPDPNFPATPAKPFLTTVSVFGS